MGYIDASTGVLVVLTVLYWLYGIGCMVLELI